MDRIVRIFQGDDGHTIVWMNEMNKVEKLISVLTNGSSSIGTLLVANRERVEIESTLQDSPEGTARDLLTCPTQCVHQAY